MRHCVFCDEALGGREPGVLTPGRRHAYDPHLGRLWQICPRCSRWNPVPLELRWEALEGWEEWVRREGRTVLETEHLALVRVGDAEVVRVGRPPLVEWGGWRYGTRLPEIQRRRGLLGRLLGSLPPAPLDGYEPFGLATPVGGGWEEEGRSRWLVSPFLDKAQPLTFGFASVPFAPECPSCGVPMPLNPWDFQEVTFRLSSSRVGVEATCAHCRDGVFLLLGDARPALRMGLGILDSDRDARKVGEEAGEALDRVGGRRALLDGLGRLGAPLGELGRTERVALGIALDLEAEAAALDREWKEAEEIASIMDGELTAVPGFQEFRQRVLGELG